MKPRVTRICVALLIFLPLGVKAQKGATEFPILNWQRQESHGEFQGLRLFMNLLRNDPALLNDETVLKHFMAANNCDNPAFEKELSNEFDYPKMAAFYRAKAPEILKTAPATLHVMLNGFYLGQYDSAKGVFPFVDNSGRKKPTTLSSIQPVNDLKDCGLAGRNFSPTDQFYGSLISYSIGFKPFTVSELPMDEASARKYVESLKTVRMRVVFLVVDLEISQVPTTLGPRMDDSFGNRSYVTFKGSLTKITVLGDLGAHQIIGTFAP